MPMLHCAIVPYVSSIVHCFDNCTSHDEIVPDKRLYVYRKLLMIKYSKRLSAVTCKITLYQEKVDGIASGVKLVHPSFSLFSMEYSFRDSPLSPIYSQNDNQYLAHII